jgi:hypothetical protein
VPAEAKAATHDVILAVDQITFFTFTSGESAGSQGEQADGEYCTQYEFHVWSRMKEFIPATSASPLALSEACWHFMPINHHFNRESVARLRVSLLAGGTSF